MCAGGCDPECDRGVCGGDVTVAVEVAPIVSTDYCPLVPIIEAFIVISLFIVFDDVIVIDFVVPGTVKMYTVFFIPSFELATFFSILQLLE